MKKLLLINTGGTIISEKTENGLSPSGNGNKLAEFLAGGGRCVIDSVQPLSLDSTNMRPAHWLIIADTVRENYKKYDGFIVTHGTDTMAYTAAGLSYIIQDSPKPIVMTGAQIPVSFDGTDAKRNLEDAVTYALDDKSVGVNIVFSGSVIAGTRARKNFSKSFAAFGSINFPELARIQSGRIIRYVSEEKPEKVRFYDFVDPNVGLIKLTPGMNNDVMKYAVEKWNGAVIESFGVGGLPEYSDFYVIIEEAAKKGKLIVMTTQVPNEGSDLEVYRVGNVLKNSLNVLEAHDMTSEAVLAKLMWISGQTQDFAEAKKLFYTPVRYDILTGD